MKVIRILLAAWLALLALPAHADPTFPALSGQVVDAANVLPADRKAALETKLADFAKATGQQVVVATIPDLQGYDISDYGYRLGRAWGIGTKERNDGALLIVAPNERKLRIEVGYGLEPVLTDAYSSVIINSVIVPKFKAGDLPGGIDAGVDEMLKQIQLPPDVAAKRAAEVAAQAKQGKGDVDGGALIFWIIVFFFVILPMIGRLRGGRRHSSGLGEALLWTAINVAANSRDGGGSDWGGGGGGGWGGGGGFSGGGGSFGGGGASGGW